MPQRPNILYLMCDQFRFDCIAAQGNPYVATPNLDRLVRRGISFDNAYSTCPVCAPARLTLRTGREPYTTLCYDNGAPRPMPGMSEDLHERCGDYLAREMTRRGYRTFGIGKFHSTQSTLEDMGYDEQMNTEEMWNSPEERARDAYAGFMMREHPEYNHIQQLHGERTNMYYFPQLSPFPPRLTVEGFVADRVVEKLDSFRDERPYFCFVSFVGPHPPCAPPVPYNLLYDPDQMPNPAPSDPEIDAMDEQIPWMNHVIWADEINNFQARNLRSRYLAEITYIDDCIGKILDAVEKRPDADNTLIVFCADHGDHLGDHHAWQKESYFEQSARIPFLLSWPAKYPGGTTCHDLVCLTDLFGVATAASGEEELRDGASVLGPLNGTARPREALFACYGRPGTRLFKAMVRKGDWKYIFLSNGGREQLFNLKDDPGETRLENQAQPEILQEMRDLLADWMHRPGLQAGLDETGKPICHEFKARPKFRIRQFDASSGVKEFTHLVGEKTAFDAKVMFGDF